MDPRPIHILGIAGSLRRASFNRGLIRAAVELAPAGISVSAFDLHEVPMFDADVEATGDPGPVTALKRAIGEADALLIATPEYNHCIPGVLKNAIDHASRPYGQSAWRGKPAGVIGITPGTMGTAMAQQHLRNVLANQDMPTMGQPEAFLIAKPDFFDAPGNIGSDSREFLQKWMDRYAEFVRQHAASPGQQKAA